MRPLLILALALIAACDSVLGLHPPPGAAADAAVGDDAGPIDAGRTPYYAFRDDFETHDFRKWTKDARSSQPGALDIATDDVHAGCCAMHAESDAGGVGFQYEILIWPQASPSAAAVTSGTIAVRAWVKARQLDRDSREMSFAEHDTSPTAFASAGFGASDPGPTYHWGFILSDPSTPNDTLASASDVTDAIGGWHCVEYVVNVATAGHLAIFMDDQPIPLIEGDANTTVNTGWDSVTVGLGYSSGNTVSEVLIDDVAIELFSDGDRGIHIGCK